MKKVVIILTIQLSILATHCFSQSMLWKYYYCIGQVNGIIQENNSMWITTGIGVFQIDKTTGNIINEYHTWNSGLPYSGVFPILIDNNGNKWMGTTLLKFDGLNWIMFKQIDDVWALAKDDSDNVWIGNWGYLEKYKDSVFTIYDTQQDNITSIAVDKSGIIWITGDEGAEKFDGVNWTIYNNFNSGLPSDLVSSVSIDKSGKKWFNVGNGIAVFDDTTWAVYNWYTVGLPYNTGNVIIDKNDNKWTATNKGAYEFDEITHLWNMVYDSTKGNIIYFDNDNNPWFSKDQQLIKFDGSNWNTFILSNSGLEDNYIRTSVIDKQNNKWFGTAWGGVTKFDNINWNTYDTTNSGLPENTIMSTYIDEYNNKWIGTYSYSLVKFDDKNWIYYNPANSVPDNENSINAINGDQFGNIWVGTNNSGAFKYDGNNWIEYYTGNSELPSNGVEDICVDKQNKKYFATDGGLTILDSTNWTIYKDIAWPIFVDKLNNLWVIDTLGLAKFDGKNWTHVNTDSLLLKYHLYSITEDSTGNLWFGTEQGASKFDGTNWTDFNIYNNNIANGNAIYTISIDSKGNKWFGSDQGIAVYNENGVTVSTPENKNPLSQTNLKIYPNPASNILNIEFISTNQQFKKSTTLQICNLQGQIEFETQMIKPKEQINIINLPQGVYFIKIQSNISVNVTKFIKD